MSERYLKWRNPKHRRTSCMDTAYVRENTPPKYPYKVQETLHFRYLKSLVIEIEMGFIPQAVIIVLLHSWTIHHGPLGNTLFFADVTIILHLQ